MECQEVKKWVFQEEFGQFCQVSNCQRRLRTKSITELRPPSHYILSDSTEPRVGVDWELSEVRKGRQQG